jgi:hypothetical protein
MEESDHGLIWGIIPEFARRAWGEPRGTGPLAWYDLDPREHETVFLPIRP